MMRPMIFICALLLVSAIGFSQTNLDQNGLKITVIGVSTANQPTRFEVATLGYNSYHWQGGGLIIIELFQTSFATGYERYVVENGFEQGANSGAPVIKLVESHGNYHSARLTLGTAYDLSTSSSGYVNRALPIYLDIKNYAIYRVKITYQQQKVDVLNGLDQIRIPLTPPGVVTADFTAPRILDGNLTSTGNLEVLGVGNHYIQNGNVGIGTSTPTEKLSVKGKIRAQEIKVETVNWPDFVFAKDYQLPSLQQTEKHILANGHLPGIPSAAEVAKDGIELGEMNKKLLQKIEEMTLYLIEMKKEIKSQQSEINLLKSKK